jgi:hypothetical protein
MKILIYASQPGHSTKRLMEEIEAANKRDKTTSIFGEVVQAYTIYIRIAPKPLKAMTAFISEAQKKVKN